MGILGKNIRSFFPLLEHHPDIIYLDNASTTQKPQSVIDAMDYYMTHDYANIHRGQYALAGQSELAYISSKKTVASFIGGDYREIVYTYNATYACNILAQSLVFSYDIGSGDTVLIGLWDHHATIVTRQLLAQRFGFSLQFIPLVKETLDIDRDAYKILLQHNKIKVVMCSHVSNVTGIVYDMERVHGYLSDDIFFAIDGSQAVPHMRISVRQLGCDAYIFTGHKMMGPTGIAVLRLEKNKGRNLQTTFGGGGIIEEVTTTGCSLIRTIDKFEPGTPNLIGAVGLAAACDFYTKHHLYDILPDHERDLIYYLKSLFLDNKKITLVGQYSQSERGGILSFAIDDPIECAELLASHDICVRAGGHCAHPLLQFLGYERGLVRISVFVYNTREDMEKIAKILGNL